MRIGVISDIHGNCLALDTVLADIRERGVDQLVCLGDAIQGGAQPAQTVARLRELGCPIVMGNADAWLLDEEVDEEETNPAQRAVRDWTMNQLQEEGAAFIKTFQPTVEIELEGDKKLLCFHGSPHSFNDIILPDISEEMLQVFLGDFDAALYTGGHTHTQQIHRLEHGSYFNPGSVGLAYNWRQTRKSLSFRADPWANYAIVSSEGERIGLDFYQIPFDTQALIDIVGKSGRPHPESITAMY